MFVLFMFFSAWPHLHADLHSRWFYMTAGVKICDHLRYKLTGSSHVFFSQENKSCTWSICAEVRAIFIPIFTTVHLKTKMLYTIHIHNTDTGKYKTHNTQADSVVSGTNTFINFWLWYMVTCGKRHNSYYADPPPPRTAHLVMFKISIHLHRSGPEKLNPRRNGRKLNSLPSWSNLNCLFFKNPQILRTISSGYEVIHIPAPFPVWGFIMSMVIVISFAHECKTASNDYAPELLTRIVQSPTKQNDKIWLTRND